MIVDGPLRKSQSRGVRFILSSIRHKTAPYFATAAECSPETIVRNMSETRLTFKEMCAEFDVTPRTLRYYEYIELLQPEREGRSRFYHPRELARMKLIMRGRKWGFSLEEIRQWLELYDTSHENRAQMEATIELADKQLKELEDRKTQICEAISELEALRDQISKGL